MTQHGFLGQTNKREKKASQHVPSEFFWSSDGQYPTLHVNPCRTTYPAASLKKNKIELLERTTHQRQDSARKSLA